MSAKFLLKLVFIWPLQVLLLTLILTNNLVINVFVHLDFLNYPLPMGRKLLDGFFNNGRQRQPLTNEVLPQQRRRWFECPCFSYRRRQTSRGQAGRDYLPTEAVAESIPRASSNVGNGQEGRGAMEERTDQRKVVTNQPRASRNVTGNHYPGNNTPSPQVPSLIEHEAIVHIAHDNDLDRSSREEVEKIQRRQELLKFEGFSNSTEYVRCQTCPGSPFMPGSSSSFATTNHDETSSRTMKEQLLIAFLTHHTHHALILTFIPSKYIRKLIANSLSKIDLHDITSRELSRLLSPACNLQEIYLTNLRPNPVNSRAPEPKPSLPLLKRYQLKQFNPPLPQLPSGTLFPFLNDLSRLDEIKMLSESFSLISLVNEDLRLIFSRMINQDVIHAAILNQLKLKQIRYKHITLENMILSNSQQSCLPSNDDTSRELQKHPTSFLKLFTSVSKHLVSLRLDQIKISLNDLKTILNDCNQLVELQLHQLWIDKKLEFPLHALNVLSSYCKNVEISGMILTDATTNLDITSFLFKSCIIQEIDFIKLLFRDGMCNIEAIGLIECESMYDFKAQVLQEVNDIFSVQEIVLSPMNDRDLVELCKIHSIDFELWKIENLLPDTLKLIRIE